MNNLFAEVLLPINFDKSFSYKIPHDLEVSIGDIVLVNFVNRNIYGCVVAIKKNIEESKFKIKTILSKNNEIEMHPNLLSLIEFASNYNLQAKGLFLKLTISILNSTKDSEYSKIFYKINTNFPSDIKITQKRQDLIDIFKKEEFLESDNLQKLVKISNSTLNALVKINFLQKNIKKINKIKNYRQIINTKEFNLKELSENQHNCANFLKKEVKKNQYSTTLLDGVTGSGKTEVYFEVIADILKDGKGQILILLPEIILAETLIKKFTQRFNFKADTWHSKINNNNKREIFYALNKGDLKVLIATRSAIFLPFSNLRLIIIDEEHESLYKQEDVVNYHGRDMSIARAKFENIPIILSSATPSLESFINSKSNKYHHLKLESKFFSAKKTKIELIDMKKEVLEKNNFISNKLREEIKIALDNNKQILLFLNRRGYAPLTLCKSCGFKINCQNCSSYLTYHQSIDKLICHHCGIQKNIKICSNCNEEDNFITFGAGSEKITEEVEKLFPHNKVALLSSDTIKNNKDSQSLLNRIINNEIDIIIGTQIIAKGHHFPNLELVGIIDADSSFNNSNLRAAEKSFQLLTQVIGRAGRENGESNIFLQSYNTQNQIFEYIKKQDRDGFYNLEINNRQIIDMPPFSKVIAIILVSKNEDEIIHNAKILIRKFPTQENISIFGPAPMPISKIRKHFYYRILVKSSKKLNIQKLIKEVVTSQKFPHSLRVKIDVDPS